MTANATKGMTAAFSKNVNPRKNTSAPLRAYRWLPVRTNMIASAQTQAKAATIGSAFNAAAHHANAGRVSGEKSANVSGISSSGRHPRITCNARRIASDATSCSTSRLMAGPIQLNGATLAIAPATRNAAGMTWPS